MAPKSNSGSTVDPTQNVKDLTEAANLRQDDLRSASDKYNDARIEHIKELVELRSDYEEKLRIAEAKRLDAIRAVDVNAVAIASEKAAAATTVLATQLTQTVDNLNKRIASVEKSQYEGQGKSTGFKDFAGWVVAAIAIVFYLLNYLK